MEIGNGNSVSSDKQLWDAVVHGDVDLLRQLLQSDPFILHRSPSQLLYHPLHLACSLGHLNFTAEVLRVRPELSESVDLQDQSFTPLHLAARNGHLDLVKFLVKFKLGVCFARDSQGRNPVHVAAEGNNLAVLNELTETSPCAARERVAVPGGGGDTVLHLCVKQGNLEALKLMVEKIGDETMLNAGDGDGNTILHLAVINKQLETITFLLKNTTTSKNAKNVTGMTPMDILHSTQGRYNQLSQEIKHVFLEAQALRSVDIAVQNDKKTEYFGSWIEHQRNTLMVIASLIATMAFQAGTNPPCGVWRDDSGSQPQTMSAPSPTVYRETPAGSSIMVDRHGTQYHMFLLLNTLGFISSMTSILLLISGFSCRRFLNVVVMITMWVAITAMVFAYWLTLRVLTPREDQMGFQIIGFSTTSVWMVVMGVLFVGHFLRGLRKLVKQACR